MFPTKAFYHPNEMITIKIAGKFDVKIWNLADEIATLTGVDCLEWTPPTTPKHGYLVQILTSDGEFWTAFDVLNHWTDAPRYGYLFDFSPTRTITNLDWMLEHHINGIQFYDWMYRHDRLLPPTDEFIDPLGREMSLDVVRKLIQLAHQCGMSAMPYTAIYAASPEFASQHMDWGLYDDQNQIYDFAEGFLKLMNTDSGWRQHFIEECLSVLEYLPFDGIHVDQYGEPQTGRSVDDTQINLANSIANTLIDLYETLPDNKNLVFNLVHNWPLSAVAQTPVDFLYCEIWAPKTMLYDLAEITQENWIASAGKTPIVAVYINPQYDYTVRMVECVILASGGYHILHGENGLYLSDPYFPKAGQVSLELSRYLKQVADFGVAYEELLTFAHPIDMNVETSEEVWTIVRKTDGKLVLNLLNVSPDDEWTQNINPVNIKKDVKVQMFLEDRIKRVWYVTPDIPASPQQLVTQLDDKMLKFNVPTLITWGLVCIELMI